MVDYFAVFGLSRSASDAEIRDAYRKLAKAYHPDNRPNDPEAMSRMQAINEAKSVLLDPVKREEHRVLLGLRESLSRERLTQLRMQHSPAVTTYRPRKPRRPQSKWDRLWSKWLTAIACVMLLGVAGVVTFQMTRPAPAANDPIREIIARYSHADKLPFDSLPPPDTMTVPNDSVAKLKRKADILFGFGEYRAASKYYEKCLALDSTDEDVMKNLSFAYFKRGRYAQSLEVLTRQMKGDSNLVVAYYNIGELFMREEKPFDARSAFQAAIRIADEMRAEGKSPPSFVGNARKQLAHLE